MAAITGRWIFLVVMALAPILIAVDAVNRKKKTERKRQQRAEEYAAELAQFRADVVTLRREERARRRRSAACAGIAAVHAEARHRRLWERGPTDSDFTSVCVGLAPLASAIEADDPRAPARRAPVGNTARDEPAGDRIPGRGGTERRVRRRRHAGS